MDNIYALLGGMGFMHLELGQAVMLVISLLLLWLAIARKFEPLLLLPIGFGGLLANIPEAGMAMTALDNLLHHGTTEQLAFVAEKLNSTVELDSIKAALNTALPSSLAQLESYAADMGYTSGILALFYKVAIGYGVAPLVIFMGVGAMTDFGPLLANPKTLLLGAAAQFGIFATVLGALALNWLGLIEFTLPQAASMAPFLWLSGRPPRGRCLRTARSLSLLSLNTRWCRLTVRPSSWRKICSMASWRVSVRPITPYWAPLKVLILN